MAIDFALFLLEQLIIDVANALAFNQAVIFDRVNQVLDAVEELADIFDIDIEGTLGEILDAVEELDDGLVDDIEDLLDDRIGNVGGSLDDFVSGLGDSLESFVGISGTVITEVATDVNVGLGRILAEITETIGDAIDDMLDVVTDALDTAIESIKDVASDVFRSIGTAIEGAVEAIAQVGDRLFEAVSGIIGEISETLGNVVTKIEDALGGIADRITGTLSELGDLIFGQAQEIFQRGQELFEQVQAGINDALEGIFTGVDSAIDTVREALDSVGVSVSRLLDEFPDILREAVTLPITGSGELVTNALSSLWTTLTDSVDSRMEDQIAAVLRAMGLPESAVDRYVNILDDALEDSTTMNFVVVLFLGLQLVQGLAALPVEIASQRFAQDIAEEVPFALPSAGDLQLQTLLGLQNDDDAIRQLQRQGFSQADAERLLGQRRRLPDIGIIQVWFLREFIDRETAETLLQRLGLESDDADRMLQMAFFVPPVQDLITMAVREVFTPEIAESFGQFEDFPEDFQQFAAQQGISEFWARNYWAAHWALPSLQMGFQMLHRGVIDESELDVLLRSQDVMPFWRDKLTAISFNPLTRVDIRRMHKLGLLTTEELVPRYMAVGFSRDDAEKMRDFTIAFNAPEEPVDPTDLTQLNRSLILGLFADGVIQETVALSLLTEIGLSEAAAAIFIEATRLDVERDDRKAQTDLILEQAQAGILTFIEAQDALGSLGLEPAELSRAITTLERRRASATRLPSRSDLDNMLSAGLIEEPVYIATLQRLGYSEFWAERFLSLARA